jgi:hypothetical protein
MRFVIATLAMLAAIAPAGAISRYNVSNKSCAEARAIVRSEGAVILRFRPSHAPVPRYGRFVVSDYFCASNEIAEETYIATGDTSSCPVLECHPHSIDDDFFLLRRHHR